MNRDCTELFVRYREVARAVWNFGFWPNPDLREWDAVGVYREAMARLFEGMVLMALGYSGRIENKYRPGEIMDFTVIASGLVVKLSADRVLPSGASHVWDQEVWLGSKPYQLKFMNFFDWEDRAPHDLRLLEVLIVRLDERPDLVGHHALIELSGCSVWLADDDGQVGARPACEATNAEPTTGA